jgi:hypothetical protein
LGSIKNGAVVEIIKRRHKYVTVEETAGKRSLNNSCEKFKTTAEAKIAVSNCMSIGHS